MAGEDRLLLVGAVAGEDLAADRRRDDELRSREAARAEALGRDAKLEDPAAAAKLLRQAETCEAAFVEIGPLRHRSFVVVEAAVGVLRAELERQVGDRAPFLAQSLGGVD